MTEWHARYRGPGVMIYWHVEKNAVCIYSQLKACSSSEVAAMIEGLLRHCTEAKIDRNYVDTHGQSAVGFAFRAWKLITWLELRRCSSSLGISIPRAVPRLSVTCVRWCNSTPRESHACAAGRPPTPRQSP
jgi:hypothetical protein